MRRLCVFAICFLCLGGQLKAANVISEKQAIQAVRNMVGNQTAEVVWVHGKAGITSADPSSYFLFGANPSNFAPYYELICRDKRYFVNPKTGFVDSILVESNLKPDLADPLTVDTIWRKYPMLPKSQMCFLYYSLWMLKYPDGSLDSDVKMQYRDDGSGVIKQVLVACNPMPASRPKITVTKKQAVTIAEAIAGSHAWSDANNIVHALPYYVTERVDEIYWHRDDNGLPQATCEVDILFSSDPSADKSWLDWNSPNTTSELCRLTVDVDAVSGSIASSHEDLIRIKEPTKPFRRVVPISTLQLLARGHKITANGDDQAFTLDGKRIALPSKVIKQDLMLYLPWQSLNYLPGVKATYDAECNDLAITTTGIKKAK